MTPTYPALPIVEAIIRTALEPRPPITKLGA